ncbi:MAG: DNA polymerase III subunit delta' [Candidatus Omnitrophica bacterium]|nr:DNA polymerase III subunit delta' [Candidatus Omnitrophota bacterium]
MAFKDIKGHSLQISVLQRILQTKRVAGAYLFSGPTAVGKFLTAVNFAKAIQCINQTDDCCQRCHNCLAIERRNHPDVYIVDKQAEEIDTTEYPIPETETQKKAISVGSKSKEIKIEEIRQLQQELSYKPTKSCYKVVIINDAHNLNSDAANAFLKTLEEPPGYSVIILVTDKKNLLYPTIISRCKLLKFSGVNTALIEDILAKQQDLSQEARRYLAYFYEGSLGKAVRENSEQLLTEKKRVINLFFVQRFPNTEQTFLQDKERFIRSICFISLFLRDLYFLKAELPPSTIADSENLPLLESLAKDFSLEKIERIMYVLKEALLYTEQNVNLKLLLNMVLSEIRS